MNNGSDNNPYFWNTTELTRLAVYRYAVTAGFYNDGGSGQPMDDEMRVLFSMPSTTPSVISTPPPVSHPFEVQSNWQAHQQATRGGNDGANEGGPWGLDPNYPDYYQGYDEA